MHVCVPRICLPVALKAQCGYWTVRCAIWWVLQIKHGFSKISFHKDDHEFSESGPIERPCLKNKRFHVGGALWLKTNCIKNDCAGFTDWGSYCGQGAPRYRSSSRCLLKGHLPSCPLTAQGLVVLLRGFLIQPLRVANLTASKHSTSKFLIKISVG